MLDVMLAVVVIGDLVLLSVVAPAVVGLGRLTALRDRIRERTRPLVLLAGVLVFNGLVRDVVKEASWIVGWNITGTLFAIEGSFVAGVQSFATPELTAYFSFTYLVGYTFLLTFPLLAYLALANPWPLRTAVVAYSLNYLGGLVCYLLFIAYGPRNLMPQAVTSLLYVSYPGTQLLTSRVNASTNVFPSLHTSLSLTVALLAWRTREVYPRWVPVATIVATSVIVSTMYLGIHWATDVAAGALLAVASVLVAERLVGAVHASYDSPSMLDDEFGQQAD